MIQIRNVPPGTHRKLKARAALEEISMSQFILREIDKALARPSRQEVLAAIRALSEPESIPRRQTSCARRGTRVDRSLGSGFRWRGRGLDGQVSQELRQRRDGETEFVAAGCGRGQQPRMQ